MSTALYLDWYKDRLEVRVEDETLGVFPASRHGEAGCAQIARMLDNLTDAFGIRVSENDRSGDE